MPRVHLLTIQDIGPVIFIHICNNAKTNASTRRIRTFLKLHICLLTFVWTEPSTKRLKKIAVLVSGFTGSVWTKGLFM